jgi:peptidoglycan hydrolase-like protein with peptidoglycan-binding domain
MKKLIMLFAFLTTGLSVSGCNPEQLGFIPNIVLDKPKPVMRITEFSDALKNLGRMMDVQRDRIFVSVEPIENKTAAVGALPNDITMMVESALTKVGRSVVVIPYESTAIGKALAEGHRVFAFHGAITEFDKDTETQGGGFNIGAFYKQSDAEGSNNGTASISSITLDFTILDMNISRYVSGIQVSNTMRINKVTRNRDIGFSIVGNGLGINGQASKQQGVHAVLRLLVELCMVETIGQFKVYPYWVGIHDSKPHVDLLDKLMREFKSASGGERISKAQTLMALFDSSVSVDGVNGPGTRSAAEKLKRALNIFPQDGKITNDFYRALLSQSAKIIPIKS